MVIDVCLNTWGRCDFITGRFRDKDEPEDHECFGEITLFQDNTGETVYDHHEGPCECVHCGEKVNALWVLTVGNYGDFIELEAVLMYSDGLSFDVLVL